MENTRKHHSLFRHKFGASLEEIAAQYGRSRTYVWQRLGADSTWKLGDPLPEKPNFRVRSTQNHLAVIQFCRGVFFNIRQRCTNPNDPKYQWYGGKHISPQIALEEIIYLWVRDKAGSMIQPSIDRLDCAGDYTLENCRFIEMDENRRNRSYFP